MPEPSCSPAASLIDLLAIEKLDEDLYRGAACPEEEGRVFGGQVIAQALYAAAGSVGADRPAHSLHAYFLRAGDAARPIVYRVLRDFDGGSFANRRVVAMQEGKPILNLAASFHRTEEGFAHAQAMPQVAPPEACVDLGQAFAAAGQTLSGHLMDRLRPFDIRVGQPRPHGSDGSGMPFQHVWFRLSGGLETDPTMARVVLAYASDFALLTTSVLPHGVTFFSRRLQAASLDHALWFHATPPVGDWLLYAMDSPWAGAARGFTRGSVFDRSGALVASVAQEGLIRPLGQG